MTFFRRYVLALPLLCLGSPALAATNLTGPYTITVQGTRSGANGQTLCAVISEDGSTLGYPNSGSFTLEVGTTVLTGKWFTKNYGVTFEVNDNGNFIVFSGQLGKPQITGTSFIEVVNGEPFIGGTFTATKGCATN